MEPVASAASRLEPPAWLDEVDPTPGPPFLAMGVRALDPSRWFTIDDAAAAAKRIVLAGHRDEAVAVVAGLGAESGELESAVVAAVGADPADGRGPAACAAEADGRGPAACAAEADGRAGAGEVGAGPARDDGDASARAIERAARLVAEDLCLLVRREGRWVLGAGCVCFPSHWRLRDKLGRPMAEVHGPVPHYADELAARVDRFLDRLTVGRGAWRRNWLIHTDDRLFAPVPAPPPDPPLSPADAGDRLWLRSERQTLRRLPGTGAIVFTIRTEQVPLATVAARPDLRARMAESVASWSADLVAYRGGEAVRGPLLAWLREDGVSGR